MQELDEVKAENENLFMEVERLKLARESKASALLLSPFPKLWHLGLYFAFSL